MTVSFDKGYPVVSYDVTSWKSDFNSTLFSKFPEAIDIQEGSLPCIRSIYYDLFHTVSKLQEAQDEMLHIYNKLRRNMGKDAEDGSRNMNPREATRFILEAGIPFETTKGEDGTSCFMYGEGSIWNLISAMVTEMSGLGLSEPIDPVQFDWSTECDQAFPWWRENTNKSHVPISDDNISAVCAEVFKLNSREKDSSEGAKFILEIGVDQDSHKLGPNHNQSNFTKSLKHSKGDDVVYCGVDFLNRAHVANSDELCFFIRGDTRDQNTLRYSLKEEGYRKFGFKTIDILLIDGDHSIAGCFNDFLYADMLSEDGVIIIHDTNYHPGPVVLLDCINRDNFTVERLFHDQCDSGLAIVRRRT